jgi:hypothetical protein
MVVSTRELRPIYGGIKWLEDMARDIFINHGWQYDIRIGPSSP